MTKVLISSDVKPKNQIELKNSLDVCLNKVCTYSDIIYYILR